MADAGKLDDDIEAALSEMTRVDCRDTVRKFLLEKGYEDADVCISARDFIKAGCEAPDWGALPGQVDAFFLALNRIRTPAGVGGGGGGTGHGPVGGSVGGGGGGRGDRDADMLEAIHGGMQLLVARAGKSAITDLAANEATVSNILLELGVRPRPPVVGAGAETPETFDWKTGGEEKNTRRAFVWLCVQLGALKNVKSLKARKRQEEADKHDIGTGLSIQDVHGNHALFDLTVGSYHIHGGTDIKVVVTGIEYNIGLVAVLELKESGVLDDPVQHKTCVRQTQLELVAAALSSSYAVFAVLTDLGEHWEFFHFAEPCTSRSYEGAGQADGGTHVDSTWMVHLCPAPARGLGVLRCALEHAMCPAVCPVMPRVRLLRPPAGSASVVSVDLASDGGADVANLADFDGL